MAEENLATRRARLTSVEEVVTNASKATLATCIATARKWFNEFFVLSIKQVRSPQHQPLTRHPG